MGENNDTKAEAYHETKNSLQEIEEKANAVKLQADEQLAKERFWLRVWFYSGFVVSAIILYWLAYGVIQKNPQFLASNRELLSLVGDWTMMIFLVVVLPVLCPFLLLHDNWHHAEMAHQHTTQETKFSGCDEFKVVDRLFDSKYRVVAELQGNDLKIQFTVLIDAICAWSLDLGDTIKLSYTVSPNGKAKLVKFHLPGLETLAEMHEVSLAKFVAKVSNE